VEISSSNAALTSELPRVIRGDYPPFARAIQSRYGGCHR
jgi:hypothetical protein